MALHGTRVVQQLPSTAARAMAQSRPSTIGLITLGTKETGKPSARNSHAGFDAAGTGNRLTDRLVRHSQRKRGATDRSVLRGTAPVLDPTLGGGAGNGARHDPRYRASPLPDRSTIGTRRLSWGWGKRQCGV